MIVDNGKYYLYRHIRTDKNQPFYIGIGQKEGKNRKKITSEYRRAYVKNSRNPIWKRVVEKTEYKVEVLFESNSKSFIEEKEKEFINMYGLVIDGNGILANMTKGGDYYPLMNRSIIHGKNNISYDRRIELVKNTQKPEIPGAAKAIWAYDKKTGGVIKKFNSMKDASGVLNVNTTSIYQSATKYISVKNYLFSFIDLGKRCNIDMYRMAQWQTIPVYKIDPKTKSILEEFPTGALAAKSVGRLTGNLFTSIEKGHLCGGFLWAKKK